ncbi:MAG TPA: alpha/beta hydrolase [bacterium]|nr:alpha/beta hydrolase [bacterium]
MENKEREIIAHPLITEVLFFPRRLREDEVPRDQRGRIVYIPAGEDKLGAYYFQPHPRAPTVLFFHGNGEVMTDYLYDYHEQVAALGLNFLVVDYRGYGLSTGRPSLPGLLEDARAAWAHVTGPLGIAPEDVIVMGRSLGSLGALEIISHAGGGARALIIESGIARFDSWIAPMAPLLERLNLDVTLLKSALRRAFDNETKIKSARCPVLIMHAPQDEIVPAEHAHTLAAWSDPARTVLHIFPRGGHNDIQLVNRRQYFKVMQEFMSRRK